MIELDVGCLLHVQGCLETTTGVTLSARLVEDLHRFGFLPKPYQSFEQ